MNPNQLRDARTRSANERRAEIANMRLRGITSQRTIAAALGVSPATICGDMKILEAGWKQQAEQDIVAAKGLDLERLEKLIAGLWNTAIVGNTWHVDRVLALMQHRAKLLGTEAPATVNLEMRIRVLSAAAGLTDEETEAAVAEAQRLVTASAAGRKG